MTVNYTTNLALGQPVTGTESGTWGDDVNNSVTSYLDIAIAGGLSVTVTVADVTLVLTQGTSSATNIGSTTAQYAILNVSGAMTAARNLILPSSSRQYVINNNTTGGFALTVKGSATSGVTMVNGEKAHVFWNGSDYAKVANTAGVATFTDLTYTGTLTGSTGVIAIGTNQIYKDSSGNVGIGVTPSAWSTLTGLDINTWAGIGGYTNQAVVSGNAYYNGGWKYKQSNYATRYEQNSTGIHAWFNAASGTAGNAISFTQAMTLDASGNVGIGTSSPAYKLDVNLGNLSGAKLFKFTGSTLGGSLFGYSDNGGVGITRTDPYNTMVYLNTSNGIEFYTASTLRATIDSSGNVGIGTSSPSAKLQSSSDAAPSASGNMVGALMGSAGDGAQAIALGASTGDYTWIQSAFRNNAAVSAASLRFYMGSTERMRIDSSGNVLVGITSANGGGTGNIQISASSKKIGYYEDGSHDGYMVPYDGSGFTNLYNTYTSGGIRFWTGVSGGTERMRIDSSGNVGIGTSSPAAKLHVYSSLTNGNPPIYADISYASGGTAAAIRLNLNSGAGGMYLSGYNGAADHLLNAEYISASGYVARYTTASIFTQDGEGIKWFFNQGLTAGNVFTPTERMRIDSSGNLLVGTTNNAGSARVNVAFSGPSNDGVDIIDLTNGSGSYFIAFRNSATTAIGTVSRVSTTNAVTYNTTSDYRLKNVLGVVTGHGERIDALKPIDYQWKEGNAHARGFLAHEFQEVYANSVTGTKDAVDVDGNPVYQGMQASSTELIADLVAEIQSLRKRLADAGIA